MPRDDFAYRLAELAGQSRGQRRAFPMPSPSVQRGPITGTSTIKESNSNITDFTQGMVKASEKVGSILEKFFLEPSLERRRELAKEDSPEGRRAMASKMFENYWNMTPESRAEMEQNPNFQQLMLKLSESAPALIKKREDGSMSFYEPIPTEIQMRQQALFDAGYDTLKPPQGTGNWGQYNRQNWEMQGFGSQSGQQFSANTPPPEGNIGASAGAAGGYYGSGGGGQKSGGMMGGQQKWQTPKPPDEAPLLSSGPPANAYAQTPTGMPGQQGALPLNRNEILFAKEIEMVKKSEAALTEANLKQAEFDALKDPNSPQGKELASRIRYYNGLAAHHAQSGALMKEQRLLEKDENAYENKVLKDVGDQIAKIRTTAYGRPTRDDQTVVNGHYLRGITDLSAKFPTMANTLASQMLAETHGFYTDPKSIDKVTEGQVATDLHQVRRAIAAAPGIGQDKDGKKILNPEDVDYYCRILDAIYNSQHRHLLSDNEVSIVKSFQEQRSKRMMR